ncbi:MAG TPA: ribonuclease HI family protein [Terracidiphilus sp.]|nr:ribonuclease HI family protein [Terracidiphilus sp.]
MNGNLFENPASPPTGDWFTAHCDGGSRGNPGPSAYGVVVTDASGREVAKLSKFLGRQTNNYAEYSGLLAALQWAAENGAKHLRVVSDSELMVKQMKGQYKVANPVLRPMWEEAKRLARQLEGFEIRHTLREGNREADRLANEAMDQGMGKTREQGTGNREPGGVQRPGSSVQGTGIRDQRSEQRDQGAASSVPRPGPGDRNVGGVKQPRQVLDGYVKGGVVHLLEGELPDGVFVKVIRE